MPINELGQSINDKGNILCQKIGTKKTLHLSPHMVRNKELMAKQGWEVVMAPEAPPRKGNSSFSAASYDEEKNQREAMETNDEKGGYKLNPEKGEITFKEAPVSSKSINLTENNSQPVESKTEDEALNQKLAVTDFENNKSEWQEPAEPKIPKKRGRKPGTKITKKVTQPKKEKINA